jgi:hypothetical protein
MPLARPTLAAPTYLDLLHPDGTVNRAAFDAILQSRIAAEIDLRLCGAAGKFAPAMLPLGEVRAWRAAQAKRIDPATVPQAERARIAAEQRAALAAWVMAMQRGAAAQRDAMERTGGEMMQAAE